MINIATQILYNLNKIQTDTPIPFLIHHFDSQIYHISSWIPSIYMIINVWLIKEYLLSFLWSVLSNDLISSISIFTLRYISLYLWLFILLWTYLKHMLKVFFLTILLLVFTHQQYPSCEAVANCQACDHDHTADPEVQFTCHTCAGWY